VRRFKDHPLFFSTDSGALGAVFRWEIKDIEKRLGLSGLSRREEYLLAGLVQYVRSTKGINKDGWEIIKSLF